MDTSSYNTNALLCLNETFSASPLGLWVVMKMLSNGLGSVSYDQINHVFDVYKTFNGSEDLSEYVNMENFLYVDFRMNVKRSYLDSLRSFSPLIITADMQGGAMRIINSITFKGSWKIPFDPVETKLQPFFNYSGSGVLGYVEMMNSYGPHRFSLIENKIYVLELMYVNTRYSMILLMPLSSTMTTADVCELNVFDLSKKLDEALEEYGPVDMNLYMPKFELNSTNDMNSILRDANVVNIFDPKHGEDFGRISDDRGLYVSAITQRTKVTVDEHGASASAKSEVVLSYKFGPETFRFDSPFNFHIIDKKQSLILFKGALTKPTYSKS